MGQLSEMYMDLSPEDIENDGNGGLREKFDAAYEEEFGADTAWRNAGLMLVNYVITGIAVRRKPVLTALDVTPHAASMALTGRRPIYLPDVKAFVDTRVYDADKFDPGAGFDGPGIIEGSDATIYVPADASVERDGYMNFRLNL
jgi:N-methylhydantoinase A